MKIKLFLIVFIAFQFSYSQNFKFGKVSKEELIQKEHPLEPSAKAAVLYREKNAVFEFDQSGDFQLVVEVYERIKIYDKEGYKWATSSIGTYDHEIVTGLKGTTYFLDDSGKIQKIKLGNDGIFDEETTKYYSRKKFTLPNLKEGCVIEYKYKVRSPFFIVEKFRLQEKIPINKLDVSFHTYDQLVFKYRKQGWIPFKVIEDQTQRVVGKYGTYSQDSYKVSMENVPSVKVEAHAGNIYNYTSALKFELNYTKFHNRGVVYYATDWDKVTRKIYESDTYKYELAKTGYFNKDLDNLLDGVSNENEKILRVFEFVKSKVSWNSVDRIYTNDGVKDAYKNGVGNSAEINLMLTAMLRYAKINANPILVSTKNHGIPVFPTRNGFNYVICGVEQNNKVLLLDASNKNGEINILEPKLLNWQGRLIRVDGSSNWIPLIPSKHAVNNTMISASISEDLDINGTVKMRLTGNLSQKARTKFEIIPDDEKRKILENENDGIEISNASFDNLETLNKPIAIIYDFETTNYIEEIGGKLYFSPMLFKAIEENPFKMEDRKYPIDYNYPKKERTIINIQIPDGYSVAFLPENTSFGLGNSEVGFKYNISNHENTIKLMVDFSVNQSLIPPDVYKNLKGFYQLMIEKMNEKVVLIKK